MVLVAFYVRVYRRRCRVGELVEACRRVLDRLNVRYEIRGGRTTFLTKGIRIYVETDMDPKKIRDEIRKHVNITPLNITYRVHGS